MLCAAAPWLAHFLHLRTQSCRETPITQQTKMTIIAPIFIFTLLYITNAR